MKGFHLSIQRQVPLVKDMVEYCWIEKGLVRHYGGERIFSLFMQAWLYVLAIIMGLNPTNTTGIDQAPPKTTTPQVHSKKILRVGLHRIWVTDGAWSKPISRPKRDRKLKSNDEFYYY